MSVRGAIILIILIAAAAGSWWATSRDTAEPVRTIGKETIRTAYYLLDSRFLGTSDDGEFIYELVAKEASQESADSDLLLTDVSVAYVSDTDVPWHLTAQNGVLEKQTQNIRLTGSVRLYNDATSGDKLTELRTEYLELDANAFTAQTDERVTVIVGDRRISATGMLASLKDNRVELKSNVSGKFLP